MTHWSGQNRILPVLQVKNYSKAENYTQTSLRGAKVHTRSGFNLTDKLSRAKQGGRLKKTEK